MRSILVICLCTIACASTPRLEARVVPQYLCGDVTPVLSWQASEPVRVTVTDAKGGLLYDGTTNRRAEPRGELAPIQADALPLTVRAKSSQQIVRPLDVKVMSGTAWFDGVAPTEVDYTVYERKMGESQTTAVDLVPYAGRPATDKGTGCRMRTATGQCLDIAPKVQNWEVGIIVRRARWKLADVFAPQASVLRIENTTQFDIGFGDRLLTPGQTIDIPASREVQELELEASIAGALKIKCGLENRYNDGRCVGSEGMTTCRADSGDARMTACVAPQLGLRIRASCGQTP